MDDMDKMDRMYEQNQRELVAYNSATLTLNS